MNHQEWERQKTSEAEVKRLRVQVETLKHRLKVAEAAARAAEHGRDVAIKMAADPWRRPH